MNGRGGERERERERERENERERGREREREGCMRLRVLRNVYVTAGDLSFSSCCSCV